MRTAVAPTLAPVTAPLPRRRRADDWLRALGNVPLHRILVDPPPGTATVADVTRLSDHEDCGVELVEGTLVEEAGSLRDSAIAVNVITLLANCAEPGRTGIVSGEHGPITMRNGNVRMPDAALVRRADLPDGRLPDEAAPRLAPALVVEVLSPSNTAEEMRIKLREYFENGVRIVWTLDPPRQTLRVHDAPDRFRQLTRDDTLDGGVLVPGLSVRVGELFEV